MRKLPQFRVMKKQCDECLFSDDGAVPEKHRQEVLEQCVDEGRHLVCSKASGACVGEPPNNEDGAICCRGFYDHNPEATVAMRLAHILNIVVFVDAPTSAVE